MSLIFRVNPPYQWVHYEGGRVEEFGEVATLADLPKSKSDEVIGVLDAALSSFHRVEVPAKNAKQLTAAVPYALEETLTDDIDNLHFTVADWQPGKPALVIVTAKQVMTDIIDNINATNINMDRLIPELMLVPIHEAANETLVESSLNGDSRYLMASRTAPHIAFDEDLLEMFIDGLDADNKGLGVNSEPVLQSIHQSVPELDARHWEIGDSIRSWLDYTDVPKTDLLHSDFQGLVKKTGGSNGLRWAAALFGTALFLKCLFDSYEYISLYKENIWIDEQMAAVMKESFPNVNNVMQGKERFIMQQQLNAANNGSVNGEFHDFLAVIAKARKQNKFTIDDIRFQSGALNLTCTLRDFSEVDKLTALLGQQGVDAKLTSSAAEGNDVSARYTLRRRS